MLVSGAGPLVRHRASARGAHVLRVFGQHAAGVDAAAGAFHFASRAFDVLLRNVERQRRACSASMVIVSPFLHHRQRSAQRGFRRDVADDETVRAAARNGRR